MWAVTIRDRLMSRDPVDTDRYGNCPKCGRKLVERKGKFGPFLGCTGYPDCRHTQSNDDYQNPGDFSGHGQDEDGHWR